MDRRDFMKTTAAAAAAIAATSVLPTQVTAGEQAPVYNTEPVDEIVPGLRAQAKGIKIFVEHEFAPLKAALIGNPSEIGRASCRERV